MHVLLLICIFLTCLSRFGVDGANPAVPSSAALKFCQDGRVYMARLDQCPGGLLLKSKFRHLAECICSHGVFLHKGSSSSLPFDGIVANSGLHCNEYKFRFQNEWNLFLPLAPPSSPFLETITMIPYEKGTERLDYFQMRRYTMDAVSADGAPPVMEDLHKKKIFFVGNRKGTETGHHTEVQVGSLCVNVSTGFNDGVYVQDMERLSNSLNVSYRVGQACSNGSFRIQISDSEKVYRYENYVKGSCSLPSSCLHTPDTVFELPKLSRPRYYDDQVQSQRRPMREAACEIILEENVQLAEYFTRLLHKQILKYPVVALPMQILQASVEAFKAAIEDNVVPHQFLDQVFTYFNYLYFDKVDTRTDKEFGEKLLYSIDTCRANSRELHFIMDSCPAQVQWFKKPASIVGYEFFNVILQHDRKFNGTKYDLIPEVVFKLINFAYNYCKNFLDPSLLLQDYFRNTMTKLLLTPSVQRRWGRSCTEVPSYQQYRSILPFGDLSVIMSNIDSAAAAVLQNSNHWIDRPEIQIRKKRSILEYENYEIWNGEAYCLQLGEYPESRGPATWGILPDITRLISP